MVLAVDEGENIGVGGSVYSKLARIPLFTGMSLDELHRIVSKVKISFLKFSASDIIVRQGDRCGYLCIILDGLAKCSSYSDDAGLAVDETVSAPAIMEVNGIFGLYQSFSHTFEALEDVSVLKIDKNEVQKILSASMIFRLNVVNALSTRLQKKEYDLWRPEPAGLPRRIISFLRRHCLTPSGQKMFHVKMQYLATELNVSRIDISRALNSLQDQSLLCLHRGRIEVPAMQKLIGTL